jgi:hypothetical protein
MLAKLSTVAVWIDQGQVKRHGAPADVIKGYCEQAASLTDQSHSADLSDHPGRRVGMSRLLRRISLSDSCGRPITAVPLGGTFSVDLELADFVGESDTTLMIWVCDVFGTNLALAHSRMQSSIDLAGLRGVRARCMIEDFRLVPGDYSLTVAVGDSGTNLDRVDNAIGLTVLPANIYGTGKVPTRKHGLVALAAEWQVAE